MDVFQAVLFQNSFRLKLNPFDAGSDPCHFYIVQIHLILPHVKLAVFPYWFGLIFPQINFRELLKKIFGVFLQKYLN